MHTDPYRTRRDDREPVGFPQTEAIVRPGVPTALPFDPEVEAAIRAGRRRQDLLVGARNVALLLFAFLVGWAVYWTVWGR